ncbi:Uncharacterized protein SCF082_LOCUS2678 [Durusdinium trenchii]|uniref:Uncharacterized protein n=1 Tax=Durusdinium trenchii TaxID=1381693 RepID=A0ABP0HP39_9DINO
MTTLFAWFLALCLAHGAIADENIPEALDADDQCTLPGCAVNALQLHVRGPVEPVGLLSLNATEEELMEWHQDYYGHKPRADISVANYKSLMQNISVQQKAILALWNRSVKLEEEVHALVQQVQHDSGLKVADYIALVEDADMPSREQAQENQQTMDSLFQTDPTMPGDHIGIGDELWRSVMEIITNIHTANKSANDLKDHIQKVNKMIVDFNEGKLIPNEGMDGTGK